MLKDGFGWWLAGLLDGEGSFLIVPNRPGFVCRAQVALRNDDTPIIEEIHRRTGIGRLLLDRRHNRAEGRMPLSIWRVERKEHCRALVDILDRYPLRTKKARDYAIWREAVLVMSMMPRANGLARDWTRVAELKERLTDVRRHPDYVEPAARVRTSA